MKNGNWFTTTQVAKILNIPLSTINNWVKSGQVEAVQGFSNRHLIPEIEVNRLIEMQKQIEVDKQRLLEKLEKKEADKQRLLEKLAKKA